MSEKITESAIEKFAIELLEKQGFEYIYAPEAFTFTKSLHANAMSVHPQNKP